MAMTSVEDNTILLGATLTIPRVIAGISNHKQALADQFKTQDYAHWHHVFAALDVCVEPVLSLEEALHTPLAVERGWVVDVPLSEQTDQTEPQLACPIKFSRSQPRYDFIAQGLGDGKW